MKKLILLLAFGVFTATFTFGQQDDCGVNSIFGQPLLNPPSAYTSDEAGNTQLDNFYGLTEDIAGMTFWGFMNDGNGDCYSSGSQDFEIKFYQDNSGGVGTLVTTFTVTVTPSNTGLTYSYNGHDVSILKYDVSFPSNITLSDGWFSAVKSNPTGNSCRFYFLNTTNGDDHSAYITLSDPSTIHYVSNNRAFCLNGVPPIPLSKWAVAFGVLLILGFIVIRYKTKMA